MVMKVVNITELARIERSSGKVYPEGCTLIQINATNGQVLYQSEEGEVPNKYAVLMPNDKVVPKYLFHAVSHQAPRFFHAIQTGLNIQVEALSEMNLFIDDDLDVQRKHVEKLQVLERMEEQGHKTIELMRELKKGNLNDLFV